MSPFFPLRRVIADLPISRKLWLIIGLFCIVVFGLLSLSFFGMNILSGSRAYVGGEALYSKSQKKAVQDLTRYALFRKERDYQKYLSDIHVPLGDHEARLALSNPTLNYDLAAQGFIQGRNHPADVRILIWMARHLNRFYYMSRAIHFWEDADSAVQDLQSVGTALHAEILSTRASPQRVQFYLDKIQTIDARLTPLEDEFSFTLGAGARWLKRLLLKVMVLSTGALLGMALFVSFVIWKHLVSEIDHLRAGAARIAGGDYSISLHVGSKDEIGELSRTFQRMAAQRQEAERLKDEFFANVSHELRTPLTLILSPLESLLAGDYGVAGPRVNEAHKLMHSNSVRLLQLVNGLLDFSKLEAGKIQVNREPLRVGELTETIYKDFQPMMHARHLTGRFEAQPDNAVVMMDRYLYERILFNLLSNAVKFTVSGGVIDVRVKIIGAMLSLTVSDTGVGIPVDQQETIFQRFHQVEGSSTRRFEGTGLGLALVKEFADLLGGKISVSSIVGKGSTFTLSCLAPEATGPVAPPYRDAIPWTMQTPRYNALREEPRPASVPGTDALPKVLIAEDNQAMAAYIASLLQPYGQTRMAPDGNEALRIAREWLPDLLLTDVMMPEKDGLSLCRDIKSNAQTAKIPVVLLTALTHREAMLDGWKAGADEYLFKPFHPKELVTRIQSLLKARQEQKLAEKKILHLNKDLQRRVQEVAVVNEELEAFSYSVSHDLRSPLRAIDGFSKELLDNCGASLDDRGKKDLSRIRAATQRMGDLIEDLLELSRVSRHELQRREVDVSEQAREIMEKFKSENPAVLVECVVAPDIKVQADPRLLQVVLTNLFQNSWKFTKQQPRPKIEFDVKQEEGKQIFFVRDNGVGFSMEYVHKLFRPFQRLHDPAVFPGSGIGLALAQRIVQRHGGQIWAEAKENRGATFYFTLS